MAPNKTIPACPECESADRVAADEIPVRCADGDTGSVDAWLCDGCSILFLWEDPSGGFEMTQ